MPSLMSPLSVSPVALGLRRLNPARALSLCSKHPAILHIHRGRAWVTLGEASAKTPETSGDRFLEPGDLLAVPAGMRLVVEPFGRDGEPAGIVCFDWHDARRPGRFVRDVVGPARETGAALVVVIDALWRMGRGLLACVDDLVAGLGRAGS